MNLITLMVRSEGKMILILLQRYLINIWAFSLWFQMQQGSGRKESKQGYCCNEAVSDSEIIVLMIIKFIEKTSMQSGYGGGVLFYIHCSLNFTLCGYMDDLGIMDSIWGTIS